MHKAKQKELGSVPRFGLGTSCNQSPNLPLFALDKDIAYQRLPSIYEITCEVAVCSLQKKLHPNECTKQSKKNSGPFRDSNSGPPAPKAGIIPLDQTDTVTWAVSLHTLSNKTKQQEEIILLSKL